MIPIVIEQRHIDVGVRCNSGLCLCPVALAAGESLMCAVDVDWCSMEFETDGGRDGFDLPEDVSESIRAYDEDKQPLYPFGFLAPLMFDDQGNPKRIELEAVYDAIGIESASAAESQ